MFSRIIRTTVVLLILLALALPAAAREVSVPMRIPDDLIRDTLVAQIYTDPGSTARAWDDATSCNFLVLSEPLVSSASGRLRIVSTGAARVGSVVGQQCLTLLDWRGTVEVFEEPWIEPGKPAVFFRVVESNLYGADGRKQTTGVVWDWVKKYVHPRLAVLQVDLEAPMTDLGEALPLFLPTDDAADVRHLLDSVSLARADAGPGGLTVRIGFDVPARAPTPLPQPEPTLSPEELQRWEAAWHSWDAFLTFVVKHAAGDTPAAGLHRQLLDVLLDARYEIVEALAPTEPIEIDPVRPLFMRTWARLAPILQSLGTGLPGEVALRYLSFIAAADALEAIDELGPDSGLEISADGMRRLARIVAPSTAGDPIAYDLAVDPVLRQLFDFGEPLPPPVENLDVDLSAWLWPRRAWAADGPDALLSARLNSWIPTREELPIYLPLVRDLLNWAAEQSVDKRQPAKDFERLYRRMMLATAWQESCWRQFIKVGTTLRPLTSVAGALGVMQVNQRVWRGFYDRQGLAGDFAYNARAGGEILMHYLLDYAVAKGEHKTGSFENLAHATYAAYNGGPGALTRYRKKGTRASLKTIDAAFWVKYQAVKDGRELAVAECYGIEAIE